jgi:hypothetical protein
MWVAQKFATYGAKKTGWVYEIYAPGGIDVNATARFNSHQSPYLWNKEIDFPGGINGRYIKGACKYHLTNTDPDTKISTFENLGCKSNPDFAPDKSGDAAAPDTGEGAAAPDTSQAAAAPDRTEAAATPETSQGPAAPDTSQGPAAPDTSGAAATPDRIEAPAS